MLSDNPGQWINPRHLSVEATAEYASRFSDDAYGSICFDDFLLEERLNPLRRVFSSDAEFKEICGLYVRDSYVSPDYLSRGRQEVSPEEWERSEPSRRLDRELLLERFRPDTLMGPGALTYVTFFTFIQSPAFLAFLNRIAGLELSGMEGTQTRITRVGHRVGPHIDASRQRKLCAVLYVNDGWRPSFGGRLIQHHPTGSSRSVDPLANRLVIFRSTPTALHEVEAVNESAGDWERWAVTIWFR